MTSARLLTALPIVMCATSACSAESGEELLAPERPPSTAEKGDAICPPVPAGIVAQPVPPLVCVPPDPLVAAIQAEVNEFWGSSVQICRCGPDSAADCEMNAFSLFGLGWIYYDPALFDMLLASGSNMPLYWVQGHEFGHELQGTFGKSPVLLARELGADCLGGYFLGSLVCQGRVAEVDLARTIDIACKAGDGRHWLDLDSHGTCDERVDSMLIGMRAYLAGTSALESCRL